jgi:hypothetical protein
MAEQKTLHNIPISSAEIAHLWTTYMNSSMAIPVLKYFKKKVEDLEALPIIVQAIEYAEENTHALTELFQSENIPIPFGFTEQDANLDAPRLYSDSFFLHYIKQMSISGLTAYGLALGLSARKDVLHFNTMAIQNSMELNEQVTKTLLSKGLYSRSPLVPLPKMAQYIQKKTFLHGVLREKRPLLAIEISNLHECILVSALEKALLMGFTQVSARQEVREYFLRGKHIATKQIEVLSSFLHEDDLTSPLTFDGEVMDATEAPFSEKLVMFQIQVLSSIKVAYLGSSIATSMRSDLVTAYSRLIVEVEKYMKEGIDIMINNGWMEQPPVAADREALAQVHS